MRLLSVAVCLGLMAGMATAQEATLAAGGVLRGLDKVNGNLTDIELNNGAVAEFGHLNITLEECRFPTGNPSGDAWAYLNISDSRDDENLFAGWMVASSPALNALDHPRYDVWVLRCRTDSVDGASE
ncbi:DUF2155 domain-containing protein [Halocynthiibacter sp.]|uniref:DUF2155 domain-containing protein n=1 Tax=Halocynthiibacter sp. TaxID=1979210 RepID=UPI003C4DCF1D